MAKAEYQYVLCWHFGKLKSVEDFRAMGVKDLDGLTAMICGMPKNAKFRAYTKADYKGPEPDLICLGPAKKKGPPRS